MSKDDRELIAELRAKLAKATGLPWDYDTSEADPMFKPNWSIYPRADCEHSIADVNGQVNGNADVQLIEATVNALPTLLDRLEALQAQPVGEDDLRRIYDKALILQADETGATSPGYARLSAMRALRTLAALTASPPVVEREAMIERLTDVSRFLSNMWVQMPLAYRRQNGDINLAAGQTLNDAILALTPAEGVGDGEALARRFHETYERLAPSFGYETRDDTKAFDPTTPNGRLMIAVCAALSTPVAQGDEVRDALEPFARVCSAYDYWATEAMPAFSYPAIEGTSANRDDCPDAFGSLSETDFRRAAKALATLTKGARDAG